MNPIKELQRDIIYKQVTLTDLHHVDSLLELYDTCSKTGRVETEKDWIMVKALWNFFKVNQDGAYRFWLEETKLEREAYKTNRHHVKEEDRGNHYLQHTLTLPEMFYHLMRRFFPNQDVAEKRFVRRFIDVVPEARLSELHHRI